MSLQKFSVSLSLVRGPHHADTHQLANWCGEAQHRVDKDSFISSQAGCASPATGMYGTGTPAP
jgi:hypothetical protein